MLKKHLNVINYSLNIHIKKNLKLLKKKDLYVFGGNFYYLTLTLIISVVYSEIFSIIFFKNMFKHLKSLILDSTKNSLKVTSINFTIVKIICFLLILFLITSKLSLYILLPGIFVSFITKNIFIKNTNHLFIILNIFLASLLSSYINNFILFFIVLEFYSIVFYFYLLNYQNNQELVLIKYKNNLLLYLFNNFLISTFFMLFMSQLIFQYGTVNFQELKLFLYHNDIFFNLLLISICLKLSLPGVHYLKIEMYKYLSLEDVVIFSITTLFVNFLLINFLNSFNFIASILGVYKITIVLFFFSVFVFLQ